MIPRSEQPYNFQTALIYIPDLDGLDIWDPNNWTVDQHQHRIYAHDDLSVYAEVDAIDYPHLVKYKWGLKTSRGPSAKQYVKRTHQVNLEPETGGKAGWYESQITGKLVRNRKRIQPTILMHREIMERTGIPQPTPEHVLVDHLDGQTFNCRRYNLQWATYSMNNIGSAATRLGLARPVHAQAD